MWPGWASLSLMRLSRPEGGPEAGISERFVLDRMLLGLRSVAWLDLALVGLNEHLHEGPSGPALIEPSCCRQPVATGPERCSHRGIVETLGLWNRGISKQRRHSHLGEMLQVSARACIPHPGACNIQVRVPSRRESGGGERIPYAVLFAVLNHCPVRCMESALA